VTIDDYIPCKDGKPLFTSPKGNEMWVLLLEKAFAKVVGGYSKLDGGLPAWALETLTGDKVAHFSVDAKGSGKWQKSTLVHLEDAQNLRKCGLQPVQGEAYSTHDFFDLLEAYEAQVRFYAYEAQVRFYEVLGHRRQCTLRGGLLKGLSRVRAI